MVDSNSLVFEREVNSKDACWCWLWIQSEGEILGRLRPIIAEHFDIDESSVRNTSSFTVTALNWALNHSVMLEVYLMRTKNEFNAETWKILLHTQQFASIGLRISLWCHTAIATRPCTSSMAAVTILDRMTSLSLQRRLQGCRNW